MADFMAKVWSDASYCFRALKLRYNRTRPHMLDARIHALDEVNFQAYPSDHASASYVAAYVSSGSILPTTAAYRENT